MTLAQSLQTIPLNRLVHSKSNVRKTARDTGIDALMASIATHGLRQNLNVRATTGNRFEVVAGGRRLEALKALAKDGRLARDEGIPCAVLGDNDNAAEISLVENAIRQDMHPDDQCTAFAALVTEGLSLDDIGARFGVTAKIVAQRLKLASVSPVLRQQFREGVLDLSQMMAFALVDDHAQQEAVWNDLSEWNDDADAIRRALTDTSIEASNRMVRFIGIETYEAEGGVVLRDLFDDEQDAVLTDAGLVEKIAMRRLEEEAAHVQAEGWSWVKVELKPDHMTHYGRVYPQLSEGDDEDEDAPLVFAAEDRARAGATLTLGYDGKVEIRRGLVTPEAMRAEKKEADKAAGVTKGLPETLVADLTAHRTAALRVTLMQRPDVALAATVHGLLISSLYVAYRADTCLELRARSAQLEVRDAGDSADHDALTTELAAWEERLPGNPVDLWDWCLAQDRTTLLDLLAFVAGMTVNAVTRREGDTSPRLRHADQLAEALGVDMTQHWTPSAEGFFSRLSKAQMIAALREAGKDEQADLLPKLPKVEAAARTAKHLAGTGWLPQALKISPVVGQGDDEVEDAAEDDAGVDAK